MWKPDHDGFKFWTSSYPLEAPSSCQRDQRNYEFHFATKTLAGVGCFREAQILTVPAGRQCDGSDCRSMQGLRASAMERIDGRLARSPCSTRPLRSEQSFMMARALAAYRTLRAGRGLLCIGKNTSTVSSSTTAVRIQSGTRAAAKIYEDGTMPAASPPSRLTMVRISRRLASMVPVALSNPFGSTSLHFTWHSKQMPMAGAHQLSGWAWYPWV